ncbi:GntR family transcriptional regulator [Microbacterium sp. M]|uniref:GntR family transcriptional regulator n=1 Tax=Microbacterium sp. M TaxID=3377125 RepID=UPI00386E740D
MTIEKNRGVVVRSVSADEIASLFEMRYIVEGAAVKAATNARSADLIKRLEELLEDMTGALETADEVGFLRADRAWHEAILDVLGNPWVHRQIQQLRYATPPSADQTTPRLQRLEEILAEHDAIEHALQAADVTDADYAVRAHLVATARSLLGPSALESRPSEWPLTTWTSFTQDS